MNKLTTAYLYAKTKVNGFLKGEVGAVDIVAIVILVGIAVVLGITFKTQIKGLLNNLFGEITTKSQGIFD